MEKFISDICIDKQVSVYMFAYVIGKVCNSRRYVGGRGGCLNKARTANGLTNKQTFVSNGHVCVVVTGSKGGVVVIIVLICLGRCLPYTHIYNQPASQYSVNREHFKYVAEHND